MLAAWRVSVGQSMPSCKRHAMHICSCRLDAHVFTVQRLAARPTFYKGPPSWRMPVSPGSHPQHATPQQRAQHAMHNNVPSMPDHSVHPPHQTRCPTAAGRGPTAAPRQAAAPAAPEQPAAPGRPAAPPAAALRLQPAASIAGPGRTAGRRCHAAAAQQASECPEGQAQPPVPKAERTGHEMGGVRWWWAGLADCMAGHG